MGDTRRWFVCWDGAMTEQRRRRTAAPWRIPNLLRPAADAGGPRRFRLDEDTTSTVVVVAIALVLALFDSGERLGVSLAALAVGALALTQKRRYPLVVLAVCIVVSAGAMVLGGAIGIAVLVLDALYSVGRFGAPGALRVVNGLVALAVLAAVVLPLVFGQEVRDALLYGLQAVAIFGTPLWWASSVRQSAELASVQAARADDAERLRVLEREEAVRDERERMARDLHDVVAANLSAIAITSEAALAGQQVAAREAGALQTIRSSALEGLEQMRSMILILRGGGQELSAPPRLAQVTELVAAAEGVDARVVGDVPRASAATEQALARVVAEAIANAERHSPGAAVEVRFASDATDVSVEVTSTGGTRTVGAPGTGNGLGLLRERAERLGGRFRAGPSADGNGWLVAATVPRHAAASGSNAGTNTGTDLGHNVDGATQ